MVIEVLLSAAGRQGQLSAAFRPQHNLIASDRSVFFSEEARFNHVPDQSTSIASSVPDAARGEKVPSALYVRYSNHASYQPIDKTTRRELRGTRCL